MDPEVRRDRATSIISGDASQAGSGSTTQTILVTDVSTWFFSPPCEVRRMLSNAVLRETHVSIDPPGRAACSQHLIIVLACRDGTILGSKPFQERGSMHGLLMCSWMFISSGVNIPSRKVLELSLSCPPACQSCVCRRASISWTC